MSTYVFITRKPDPLETAGPVVTQAEWAGLVASDPEFRVPTESEIEPVRQWVPEADRPALWLAHPESEPMWFTLTNGSIEVKNPDAPILAKMAAVASRLQARVVSESGEAFDTHGNSLGAPDEPPDPSFLQRFASWWRT